MKLLVSVRNVAEAQVVSDTGTDFIDLKEPSRGALGALPPTAIREIVALLNARPGPRPSISATIGDLAPGTTPADVRTRVADTAACGVDYVKVGLRPGEDALLDALAHGTAAVVPVLLADNGIDDTLLTRALAGPFPALMLDTEDKQAGSLLQRLTDPALRRFIARCRAAGKLAGMAGALRVDDLPRLQSLAPDFAGFRSAVCAGPRSASLDARRVQALHERLALMAVP